MDAASFLRGQARYLGLISRSLNELYGPPYFLDDDGIEATLQQLFAIFRAVNRNATALARQKGILGARARELLLEGQEPFPELDRVSDIPSLGDIAVQHSLHAVFVEDEDVHQQEVAIAFRQRGLNVRLLKDPDDFSELVSRRLFMEYWIDLGLGPEGDPREGQKLIEKLHKTPQIDRELSTVVVYTQHAGRESLRNAKRDGKVDYIISKSRQDARKQVARLAQKLRARFTDEYGLDFDNPLVKATIK